MASGAFREDLFYRINVIRIHIPPLRERADDIPLLLDYYLDLYSRHHRLPRPQLGPKATVALLAHAWPGNIRELKNIAERIVLNSSGRLSGTAGLPRDVLRDINSAPATDTSRLERRSFADEATGRMLNAGESFWSTVHVAFLAHDLTRDDLRGIVTRGLEQSNGSYRSIVQLFNMPPKDYRRFVEFLRTHDCHPHSPARRVLGAGV
jgi:DNA-binding NtrC family response regulator